MTTTEKTSIQVAATINAPVEKVWESWTNPKHIVHWNNASDDWHTPSAQNDLRKGGKFTVRMEARDKSMGFDFEGEYTRVDKHKQIDYTMTDGRKVSVVFEVVGNTTSVTETFEAENTHTIDMQREGWQAILNNFKKYVELPAKAKTLHFEIEINAAADKVYRLMLEDKTYREWTTEFNATSRYEGSWDKGSKILFLGDDEHGNTGGMVSRIKENIPNEFISIEHLGVIEKGIERTSGEDIEQWAGALENYTFKSDGGKTLLQVEMDSNEEFAEYFTDMWPKALKKLKAICER